MESWINAKRAFQTRYETLSAYRQNTLPTDLTSIQTNLNDYIKNAGNTVGSDLSNNTQYNNIKTKFDAINTKLVEFSTLNKDITNKLQEISAQNDTGQLLSQNGALLQDIKQLESKVEEYKGDAESAQLRDELVKDRNTAVNRHQLFFLNKPLSKSSIPFLWGLSILFVGIGVLIFKQMFPLGLTVTPGSFDIMQYLLDPRVLIALVVASLIVVIFLTMKILGVFDSKNKPKVIVN